VSEGGVELVRKDWGYYIEFGVAPRFSRGFHEESSFFPPFSRTVGEMVGEYITNFVTDWDKVSATVSS
jgi:hypothetical protein